MATAISVPGLATIKIASPASGSLETLGYAMNGVDITENIYEEPVYGDENGGEAGPPIDMQYLGETHDIRMTLTKFDEAVLNKIRAGLAGGTAGTVGTSGSLYFQGLTAWRLLIHSVTLPRNYLSVIWTQPKEINWGTKHQKAIVTAKAFKGAASVLYNATTT